MEATAQHRTHDPIPSKWPIITAFGIGLIPIGLVTNSFGWRYGLAFLGAGFLVTLFGVSKWWGELLRDRFLGREVIEAEKRLKTAMWLFIGSEAAIFCAFFAALLYARVHAPVWPPAGAPHFGLLIPGINTVILLSSSVTLHMGHRAMVENRRSTVIASLLSTIVLGAIFLCGQTYEYGVLNGEAFTLQSGAFGTTFFMLTGFHGLHVLMGLVFLNVVYEATVKGRLTAEQHFPFRAASWYWHFVDAVWLFVFTIAYLL